LVRTAVFTANIIGFKLLEKLHSLNFYPKIVTYDTAFRRTGLSKDFSPFEDKFSIMYLQYNKYEYNKNILDRLDCDNVVCIDWTKDFFKKSQPEFNVIQMQPSLLPKYRGYGCISEQFEKGVYQSGVTFYKSSDKVDAGDIIYQKTLRIEYDDYPEDFIENIVDISAGFIIDIEKNGLKNYKASPQNEDEAFYIIRKRSKNAIIDFGRDAYSIYNQIRAFSRPFFGAYFYSGATKVKVFRAKTEKWQGYFGEPGEIIKNDENGAEIACGSGTIALNEVEINNQIYYNYIPL